ncbi:hypothetical protein [Mariniphaga anaerophila]|uniref:hypothetical protein n=1 Tax=Mariniphaga anaerophila TaxID=1484053 RepID=UPI0015875BF2|nr:hypothetical protein [Mariniphaga anaerophila]
MKTTQDKFNREWLYLPLNIPLLSAISISFLCLLFVGDGYFSGALRVGTRGAFA